MASKKFPVTQAVRFLRSKKIEFSSFLYPYIDKGGTKTASDYLKEPENIIIKTLIMVDDQKKPLIVLMHGDKQVSTKKLARIVSRKKITPVEPEIAKKITGYSVGGISPFGTKEELPVFVESTILNFEHIFINGGKRGYLIKIKSKVLKNAFKINSVEVST